MTQIKRCCFIFALLLITSCSRSPQPGLTSTPIENPATAAAQTLDAQLTQLAVSAALTAAVSQSGAPPATLQTASPTQSSASLPTAQATTASPTSMPIFTEIDTTPAPATDTPDIYAPAVTATPPPQDPRLNAGAPAWLDSFSSAANWPLYDDEHIQMSIQDGILRMTAPVADRWESWIVSNQPGADFYLETTAQAGECAATDRFGLFFRAPDPSRGYLYGITCDGRFSLRIWDGTAYRPVMDWTSHSAIRQGSNQINRLGVKASGSAISLFANGFLLSSVSDDTYRSGLFGLFIGAAATPGFHVDFNEVAFWFLP